MSILRNPNRHRYTVIDSLALEDTSISFEAKGVLAYLLSKPDGWLIHQEHLSRVGGIGRHKIMRIFSELRKAGYIAYKKPRNEFGQVEGTEIVLCETPRQSVAKPECGINRESENPTLGKPAPLVNLDSLVNLDEEKKLNPDVKDTRASKSATPDGFDAFWSAYPRKKNRAAAIKAFKRITPDLLPTLFADIEARIRVGDWRLDMQEFIPHPATYLNGERWTDSITPRGQTHEASRQLDRPRSPGERFAALRAAQQAEARGNGQALDGDAEHFRPPVREQFRAGAVGRVGNDFGRDHPQNDRGRNREDESG